MAKQAQQQYYAPDSRCPPVDLTWMLALEDKRKAVRRGSFISTDDVPKRSVVEDNKIVDFLRSQGFTIGGYSSIMQKLSPDDRSLYLVKSRVGPCRRIHRKDVLSTKSTHTPIFSPLVQSFYIIPGLARTLIKNTDDFPARVWLIDNSASMNSADGHRVVQNWETHKVSNISCTRWEEVTATLMWHANFSVKMQAPTAVRLMFQAPCDAGQPQQVGIASAVNVNESTELSRLAQLLQQKPSSSSSTDGGGGGSGPLSHLLEIVQTCLQTPSELLSNDKSLAILYVTDRLPVDDNGREGDDVTERFLEILNLLQGTSVFVVIRLSTDEQRVVDFYNDLDRRMDAVVSMQPPPNNANGNNTNAVPPPHHHSRLHLDVLDDFCSEAGAVHEHNPWLNYAYPLHLCRESAVQFPVFDALNDRPLLTDELVEFLTLLFDRNQYAWALQPLANPQTHYADFRAEVFDMNRKAGSVYDPIKCRNAPWIDINQLDRIYGGQASSSCIPCAII